MMQAPQNIQGCHYNNGWPPLPTTASPYQSFPQQMADPNANLVAAMHRLAAALEKFNERGSK